MAILYISDDLPSVADICHHIAILHEGEIVELDSTERIFSAPQHPYTRRLIAALPARLALHAPRVGAVTSGL
jgi:ABC-type dipeptide/oligopeptide/nickel transport system ATPase component